jgi:hypothetical protein
MPASLVFQEADNRQWNTVVPEISGSVPLQGYILPSRQGGPKGLMREVREGETTLRDAAVRFGTGLLHV